MYLIKEIHWGAQESCAWRGGGQSFFLWNSVMEPMEESKHAVTARFYWPGMGVDLDKWVNGIIWLECILDWGYPYIVLLPGLHSPCLLLNFQCAKRQFSRLSINKEQKYIPFHECGKSFILLNTCKQQPCLFCDNNDTYFVIFMLTALLS